MAASNVCNLKYKKGEVNHLRINMAWICSSEYQKMSGISDHNIPSL
jgi:hypothetical protein